MGSPVSIVPRWKAIKSFATVAVLTTLSPIGICGSLARAQKHPGIVGSSPLYGALPGATGWINSGPLSGKDLKGKFFFCEFWEYSCINCIRAIPNVRAWADKYKDSGLVVIGVHPSQADQRRSEVERRPILCLRCSCR